MVLTLFFPYYNQSEMLRKQLLNILSFSKSIRQKLCVVVVDDGSKIEPALDVINEMKLESKIILKLVRIDIDIPWNQPEANNIGIHHATTDYVLRTDIDHYFTEENIVNIFNFSFEPSTVYFFKRKSQKNGNMFDLKSHPNSYIIHKNDYLKLKGYNEYFSGNYGDDIEFIPRLKNMYKVKIIPEVHIFVFSGGSTKNMKRDTTVNKQKLKEESRPHYTFTHKEHYILQKSLSNVTQ